MNFSEKLVELRKEKKVTQEEAAKGAGIPIRTFISYEREGRYPRDRKNYIKLAKFFGVEPDYLIADDEKFVIDAASKYGARGKRQAEQLVSELSGLFAGGELSEEDMDGVMLALQKAYVACKEDNKKYAPKKRQASKES